MIHTAVQTNDFDLRMFAWKKMLPFFFTLNKTDYSRYGSYYVRILESTELRYPSCKEMLSSTGLSIQEQDHYPHHTAIDQRGDSLSIETQKQLEESKVSILLKAPF